MSLGAWFVTARFFPTTTRAPRSTLSSFLSRLLSHRPPSPVAGCHQVSALQMSCSSPSDCKPSSESSVQIEPSRYERSLLASRIRKVPSTRTEPIAKMLGAQLNAEDDGVWFDADFETMDPVLFWKVEKYVTATLVEVDREKKRIRAKHYRRMQTDPKYKLLQVQRLIISKKARLEEVKRELQASA